MCKHSVLCVIILFCVYVCVCRRHGCERHTDIMNAHVCHSVTCLSVCLSVCLSIYLSVFLSVCLSVYLSIYLSVYLSICASCLSVWLSVCLSVCLSGLTGLWGGVRVLEWAGVCHRPAGWLMAMGACGANGWLDGSY